VRLAGYKDLVEAVDLISIMQGLREGVRRRFIPVPTYGVPLPDTGSLILRFGDGPQRRPETRNRLKPDPVLIL
jgi:hypothetical protein